MSNNVVCSEEFLAKKERRDQGVVISSLNLGGNFFTGSMVIEQDLRYYHVKVIFNLNNKVVIVNTIHNIYDGIDLEEITARASEEIAIHIVLSSVSDSMKNDQRVKNWLKKDQR